MKWNSIKYWYLGGVFLLILIYLTYIFQRRESIYKNGVIKQAYVHTINYGSPKGGNIIIKYSFIYKKVKYFGGIDTDLSYSVKEKLLYSMFPVLVDTTDISNNVLLINVKRWKYLNKELPDSLKWIKQYY